MAYTLASERAYIGKESAALFGEAYRTLAGVYDEAKTTVLEDKDKAKKVIANFITKLKATLFKQALGSSKVDDGKVLGDDLLAVYFGVDKKEIEKQGAEGDINFLQAVIQRVTGQYQGRLHGACYNRLDAPEKEKVLGDIEGFIKRKFKKEARKQLLENPQQVGQFWNIYENVRLQPKDDQGQARKQFLSIKGLEDLLEEE
ncbi:MAG: hypothetical protein Q7R96_05285 [Nanoarchaeota archaeon]|nr:hypothetical protein [Nanoarchaeota archaeon]